MRKSNETNASKSSDAKSKGTRRRPTSKSKGKGFTPKDKLDKPDNVGKGCGDDINDSSFYYAEPELREQLNNYAFNQFAGIPFDFTFGTSDSVSLQTSIPTIMVLALNPSAGAALTDNDSKVTNGVTRAGLKNYYILSANNAKTTNYAPQDVTMLIFALTSLMEMVSHCQRILGTPYNFNVRNRALPRQLTLAQGVDYEDLTGHLADYRIQFNILLQQINKIPIPAGIRAFMKSSALYSNFYVDDTSSMAQIYVLKPHSLWKFDEANARLETVGVPGAVADQAVNFTYHLSMLQNMISAILNSATFNYIFADILRINEKEGFKLMNYGLIPDGYIAPILYSEEFNLWVDNATLFGYVNEGNTAISTNYNDVYQDIDNNSLKYAPIRNRAPISNREYIVNFTHNNPTTEEKVAATRLISGNIGVSIGDVQYDKLICGSHYVVTMFIYESKDRNGFTMARYANSNGVVTANESAYILATMLSKFKHAPRICARVTDNGIESCIVTGDLDYYTTLSNEHLARMFDAEWVTYLSLV